MSRKTIGWITAIIGAILTVFQETFGLSINPLAAVAGIGAVLTYVFLEGKLDLAKLTAQAGRFKDPKFWLAVVASVLAAVEAITPLPIPSATIVAVLTAIMGVLFGKEFAQAA